MDTLIIGVDIGGTRTKYGLVNTVTGEVIHSIVQPTEKKDAQIFIEQIGFVIISEIKKPKLMGFIFKMLIAANKDL